MNYPREYLIFMSKGVFTTTIHMAIVLVISAEFINLQ